MFRCNAFGMKLHAMQRRAAMRDAHNQAVGGLGRITGVFYAALLIGVFDFVLKKYVPQGGTIFIYGLTIVILLFRPQGLFGRSGQ